MALSDAERKPTPNDHTADMAIANPGPTGKLSRIASGGEKMTLAPTNAHPRRRAGMRPEIQVEIIATAGPTVSSRPT